MWKGVHLNQNKYLPAQRTSRALWRGGGVGPGSQRPSLASRRPRGASPRKPRIVFLQLGQSRAGGGRGGAQRPAGPRAKGSQPRAACRLRACSALGTVFSLAFWRAPYYLFLFSLFYFYFQVAGRAGCSPFTPLPWSAARRLPEPARAQPRAPPGRRRHPGRARAGDPRAGRGAGRLGAGGVPGAGRGAWDEGVPGCSPAWGNMNPAVCESWTSPGSRDLAVIMWLP